MKNSNNSFRKQLAGLAAAVAIASSGAVQADLTDGVIDVWTVGVVGAFDCTSVAFEIRLSDPVQGTTSCSANSIAWGAPATANGQSGLDLTNAPASQVNTNGAAVPNLTVTHQNWPVFSPFLDSVNLDSTLTLTPFSPPGPGLPPATLTFNIDFLETFNAANPCANGEANGQGVNINGCADIFVTDRNALNFPFVYDLDGDGDTYDPITYFISFFEQTNGLNPLSDAACTAVGQPTGCLGFETPENQATPFTYAALITTAPILVPVPGTLAVVGLGLLALGAARRRRA